tara:strand:- start:172344 stop:172955 length:612 start_codon:yes stop_codon:yes gene_type:complete
MKIISVCIFCSSLVFSGLATAQDTITLLDGKVLEVEVVNSDSTAVTYNLKKRNKTIQKTISSELIFMIQYAQQKTDTIYFLSENNDHYLSVHEMQLFIYGEQDAKKYYKPTLTTVFGVAFGATFGYILRDGFYVASVPLVYTVAAGVSTVKVKFNDERNTQIMSHPAYQEGYIKVARSKKAFNALGSSLVGTVLGIFIGNATN